jgi:hypothetical protein
MNRRGTLIVRLVPVVFLAVGLTACGASRSSGIDAAQLESQIKSDTHLKLLTQGNYNVTVSCVKSESDSYHFTCLVTAQNIGNAVDTSSWTDTVTCDQSGGGTCIWKPEP